MTKNHSEENHMTLLTQKMVIPVVGVTFRLNYPALLTALHETYGDEGIPARLVPDDDNDFDPDAVRVECDFIPTGSHVGYLPRAVAGRIRRTMLAGYSVDDCYMFVRFHPDHPENPGAEVLVTPRKA